MAETSDGASQQENESEFIKLRHLLLGSDYDTVLQKLSSRNDTERVSEALSEAITHRELKDKSISQALGPVIDSAFENAIRNRPQRITRVIYPIIGPSIRKAVAQALAEMVRSLNQVLENSLSLRAIVWRFNAWRAGMNYGEYVLLKTLDFRVEQILLIHRETGLLLHNERAENVKGEDPELVSAMLTAINDFVSDSFTRDRDKAIENIKVGEFILEIESSPDAILVAAVRGSPSEDVTRQLQIALEKIYRIFGKELLAFNGDREIFAGAESILTPCLIEQRRGPENKRTPWLALILLILLVGYGSLKAFDHYQSSRVRHQLEQAINQTPGYMLVGSSIQENLLILRILRTEATPLPETWLQGKDVTPWNVQIKDIILPLTDQSPDTSEPDTRDLAIFALPDLLELNPDASLRNRDGKLIVSGTISEQEKQRLITNRWVKQSFNGVEFENIQIVDDKREIDSRLNRWRISMLSDQLGLSANTRLTVTGNILRITGPLTYEQWINLKQSRIVRDNFEQLDTTHADIAPQPGQYLRLLEEWNAAKSVISGIQFHFQSSTAVLTPGEEQKIPDLIARLEQLKLLAEKLNASDWQLYVIGYADHSGTESANLKISEERAYLIRRILNEHMDSGRLILAFGAGHQPNARLPLDQQRMVTLQIIHSKLSNKEYPGQ
ncbi:OmpA family outer membrane protein [Oleiphilus messinensis]|uniref:OmpA family outer membrane protein n=1 Tax=Oleiphilus messinensis TaxID=141451 RepID=A0A1Y0I7E0_9GAMM|nr:OmpA family protein [Oleiphilus messinensis]ARU56361.1 OmpA family outer membrane protein [Oleiphilus messinensis]